MATLLWVRLVQPVLLLVFLPFQGGHSNSWAQDNPSLQIYKTRTELAYQAAQKAYTSNPSDEQAAVEFVKTSFDWAEWAQRDEHREKIAEAGIAACRALIQRSPNLPAAHYYLGLNLGQLARTKTLGALRIVHEMETAFKRAIELDPKYDFAGPHRSLGMLYLEAPGWPTSIGNRSKAKQHIEKAVELFPDYPDNQLTLLEAWLKWGEKRKVQTSKAKVAELLAKAEKQLTGEQWEESWLSWKKRWAGILKQAEPEPARSGRSQ